MVLVVLSVRVASYAPFLFGVLDPRRPLISRPFCLAWLFFRRLSRGFLSTFPGSAIFVLCSLLLPLSLLSFVPHSLRRPSCRSVSCLSRRVFHRHSCSWPLVVFSLCLVPFPCSSCCSLPCFSFSSSTTKTSEGGAKPHIPRILPPPFFGRPVGHQQTFVASRKSFVSRLQRLIFSVCPPAFIIVGLILPRSFVIKRSPVRPGVFTPGGG